MTTSASFGRPRYQQLPLWRDANRLPLEVAQTVRGFSRYHKYTRGAELRRLSRNVCRLVARAAQADGARQRLRLVKRLAWRVEDLKIHVQLGKEIAAFASISRFQRIAELSVLFSKQSGGGTGKDRSGHFK